MSLAKDLGTQQPASVDPPARDGASPLWAEAATCPRCKQENSPPADSCVRCGFSFLKTHALEGSKPAPATSLVGQVINGKYRVISVLGEGGFGIVYKVELLLFETGSTFALKLLHPSLSQDKNFRRRFLREAGLAMALIHENTIQIREFGQTEDGHLFFTMDYCEGEPLKTVIARERFLMVNRALHIARQILSVMKLAHARGIIHRDLKPENIFLERDSQGCDFVKVGDFGLAKSFCVPDDSQGRGRGAGVPVEDITRGGIVGTPRYMSPEQALGKDDIDDRSDIYSVGVILHEMLYGYVPAERVSADARGYDSPLKTPSSQPGHAVPRGVWEVVKKALEVRREDRFQSSEEFLNAINALPQYTPTYLEPAPARVQGKRRLAFIAGGLLLSAVLCVSLVGLWSNLFGTRSDDGTSVRIVSPTLRERPVQEDKGVPDSKGETSAGKAASPSISPFPREGVRAYLPFSKGDVLRYQSYREGMVQDRIISFRIESEPQAGTFDVKVSPGERTLKWVIDDKENAFYQEFSLLDPETGEKTNDVRRLLLKLPRPDEVLSGDYIAYETTRKKEESDASVDVKAELKAGLKVHAEPVTLKVPRPPNYDMFTNCLCVESWEDNRIHCQYYQQGRGLVGLVVYERRQPKGAQNGASSSEKGAPETVPPAALPEVGATGTPDPGQPQDVVVYARYWVQTDRETDGR